MEGGHQEDVKISVEGADVEITKVVLHWNNRQDDTITNVGDREGGRRNGSEGRSRTRGPTLKSVTVHYKILNNASTATIKVWGFGLSGCEHRSADM